MEKRNIICISCPMGCQLTVWRDENDQVQVEGYTCPRGKAYGVQEFTDPRRTVTSSIAVKGGHMARVSCKTSDTVPKAVIPEVLRSIAACRVQAPIAIGQVLIPGVAGTEADVIATREIRKM